MIMKYRREIRLVATWEKNDEEKSERWKICLKNLSSHRWIYVEWWHELRMGVWVIHWAGLPSPWVLELRGWDTASTSSTMPMNHWHCVILWEESRSEKRWSCKWILVTILPVVITMRNGGWGRSWCAGALGSSCRSVALGRWGRITPRRLRFRWPGRAFAFWGCGWGLRSWC